jgi:hypothetical protein
MVRYGMIGIQDKKEENENQNPPKDRFEMVYKKTTPYPILFFEHDC